MPGSRLLRGQLMKPGSFKRLSDSKVGPTKSVLFSAEKGGIYLQTNIPVGSDIR